MGIVAMDVRSTLNSRRSCTNALDPSSAEQAMKIAASCFSIYAYVALKKELESIESLEFIFTSPTFVPNEASDKLKKAQREFHIPKTERERSLTGSEFEIQLKNQLTQKAIARECADWIRRKAVFRSNRGQAPMQPFAGVQAADTDALGNKLRTERDIDNIFRRAQAAFNAWSALPPEERTAAAILGSLDFDFFELLDSVTIARSRRHIETFYNTADIGSFPERRKPQSFHCPLTHRADVIGFNEIFNRLSHLKLAVYAPVSYILSSRVKKYEALYDTQVEGGGGKLKQADREKSLQALMTTNLLKRLESSVESFRLTIPGSRQSYDFQGLLTLFSPRSKEKAIIYPNEPREIDILIGTDCISEGQNLQDCDYVINYDIHWNPVRIIQRFGRVDRIGSQNASIQLVNYWPDISLDEYIRLKERVENRMMIADVTATGDDNVLNAQANDLAYRKEQLRRLQDEVIEMEDLKTGVSITDLGLNDFRMDLLNYIKANGDLAHVPNGMHAVVPAQPDLGLVPGVIFTLRSRKPGAQHQQQNRLYPFP